MQTALPLALQDNVSETTTDFVEPLGGQFDKLLLFNSLIVFLNFEHLFHFLTPKDYKRSRTGLKFFANLTIYQSARALPSWAGPLQERR